jgi:ribonuclease Y
MEFNMIIAALLSAVVAGAVGFVIGRKQAIDDGSKLKMEAQRAAQKTLDEAQAEARQKIVNAKEEAAQIRDAADKDMKERRAEVLREEDRLKNGRRCKKTNWRFSKRSSLTLPA